MQFAGVVDDATERLAPALVLAGEVMLVDQTAVAGDDDGVQVGLGPTLEAWSDRTDQRRVEPLRRGRGDRPAVVKLGRCRTILRPCCAGRQQQRQRQPNTETPRQSLPNRTRPPLTWLARQEHTGFPLSVPGGFVREMRKNRHGM